MKTVTYNLISAISGGVATIAAGIVTYLAATGTISSATTAAAVNASIVLAETCVLNICSKFVTDSTSST